MIFTSTTTVPVPAAAVWNLLLDCSTWQGWWGGSLLRVDPRWGRGGQLCWGKGAPSTIVEFEACNRLTFEGSSGLRCRFTLSEAGAGATVVTFQDDYSASNLQVTDPATVQARCDTTIRELDRYARAHAQQAVHDHRARMQAAAAQQAELAKQRQRHVERLRGRYTRRLVSGVILSLLGAFIVVMIVHLSHSLSPPDEDKIAGLIGLFLFGLGIALLSGAKSAQRQIFAAEHERMRDIVSKERLAPRRTADERNTEVQRSKSGPTVANEGREVTFVIPCGVCGYRTNATVRIDWRGSILSGSSTDHEFRCQNCNKTFTVRKGSLKRYTDRFV